MARRQGLGPQQTGSVSGVFSQEDGGVLQSQLTPDGLTSCIEAASGRAHGLFLWGHGAYAPDSWEGAYLLGIARFGFDVNRM